MAGGARRMFSDWKERRSALGPSAPVGSSCTKNLQLWFCLKSWRIWRSERCKLPGVTSIFQRKFRPQDVIKNLRCVFSQGSRFLLWFPGSMLCVQGRCHQWHRCSSGQQRPADALCELRGAAHQVLAQPALRTPVPSHWGTPWCLWIWRGAQDDSLCRLGVSRPPGGWGQQWWLDLRMRSWGRVTHLNGLLIDLALQLPLLQHYACRMVLSWPFCTRWSVFLPRESSCSQNGASVLSCGLLVATAGESGGRFSASSDHQWSKCLGPFGPVKHRRHQLLHMVSSPANGRLQGSWQRHVPLSAWRKDDRCGVFQRCRVARSSLSDTAGVRHMGFWSVDCSQLRTAYIYRVYI